MTITPVEITSAVKAAYRRSNLTAKKRARLAVYRFRKKDYKRSPEMEALLAANAAAIARAAEQTTVAWPGDQGL